MIAHRVLLTGASGVLGRSVRRRLVDEGLEVVATSRSGRGDTTAVDLNDPESVDGLVASTRPRMTLHLAAQGVHRREGLDWSYVRSNVLGVANLLAAASTYGVQSFVHVSTILAERPTDPYGASKAAAEVLVRHAPPGVTATNLRLPNVFGPDDPPTRLVRHLIASALDGQDPAIRDPERVQPYLYVDDAIDGIVFALAQNDLPRDADLPGVASISITALNRLVHQVVNGATVDVPTAPHQPAKALPGWIPRHTLEAGIRLTVQRIKEEGVG